MHAHSHTHVLEVKEPDTEILIQDTYIRITCMDRYIHTVSCVHTRRNAHTHNYMHACIHTYMQVYIQSSRVTHTYKNIHVGTYMQAHTCRTYIHIHLHTHIHACRNQVKHPKHVLGFGSGSSCIKKGGLNIYHNYRGFLIITKV